jgi:hypothetical protein
MEPMETCAPWRRRRSVGLDKAAFERPIKAQG